MKSVPRAVLRSYIKKALTEYNNQVTYIIKNKVNADLHVDGKAVHVSTPQIRNELLKMEKDEIVMRIPTDANSCLKHQIHWRLSKSEI